MRRRKYYLLTVIFLILINCYLTSSFDICENETCDCKTDAADCKQRNLTQVEGYLVIPEYITEVDLSDNYISNLQDLKINIESTALQKIVLSSNSLKDLQLSIFESSNSSLIDLDFRNNIINLLTSETFANVQNLLKLDLSYNQLSSIPDGTFEPLSRLQVFDLSFNPIKVLHDNTFKNLKRLSVLNLSFLQLEILQSEIFDWNLTISDLDLSHNYFTSVPSKALWYLRDSLCTLKFSGNLLETLPAGSFFGLHRLDELHMEQHLYLRKIDAFAFKELYSLKTFVLRYLPHIRQIDSKAFYLNESDTSVSQKSICPVKDFILEFSIVNNLPQDMLVWNEMRYVSLKNNKWNCDCYMQWIKDTKLENLTRNSIYCSIPLRFRGQNTKSMTKEDFTCVSLYISSPSGIVALFGIIIFAIIISFTTVLILVYQRNGWICNPPRIPYDKIESQLNTITIFDRSVDNVSLGEERYRDREMVYIHDG